MKPTALFCAIDLHGNNLFIVIMDATGKRIKQARLLCELHDVLKFLKPYKRKIQAIAVESTFNWYWLVDGLVEDGYEVRLANTAQIEQYDGLKHQDDKTDAWFLADLLRLGILPTGHIYDRKLRPYRDLFRRRMLVVQKRSAFLLSLRALHHRTHGSPLPLREAKAESPQEVADLFRHEADRIVAFSEKSLIDELDSVVSKLESVAVKVATTFPGHERLLRSPGIGRVLSTMILLESGEVKRFTSAEDFASYCRTVPAKKVSNSKKKGDANRKCGNRYLAWAFVEAGHTVRRFDTNAAAWYERKKARTNTPVATKALACKLAKAVWYVLATGAEYDSERLFGKTKMKTAKTSKT